MRDAGLQCYIWGQCQVIWTSIMNNNSMSDIFNPAKLECNYFSSPKEFSLDFKRVEDAEGCHAFAKGVDGSNWWSWEPAQSLCLAFGNCTETGPPSGSICPDCVSGETA